MNETDVNEHLLAALRKRWTDSSGRLEIGGLDVKEFDTSRVVLKVLKTDYGDIQKATVTTPIVVREEPINNLSDSTVKATFDYSKETTDEYQWHVTGGLKLIGGAKAKVGLPLIGEGEVSASVELSFEAGATKTHSERVMWKHSQEIDVPPHTSVLARAVLANVTFDDVPFKVQVRAFGRVGCLQLWGSPDSNNWVWGWADLDAGGWHDVGHRLVKKLPLDPVDREFTLEGVVSGAVGLHVSITVNNVKPLAPSHTVT